MFFHLCCHHISFINACHRWNVARNFLSGCICYWLAGLWMYSKLWARLCQWNEVWTRLCQWNEVWARLCQWNEVWTRLCQWNEVWARLCELGCVSGMRCELGFYDRWAGDIALTTLSGRQVATDILLATSGWRQLMNDKQLVYDRIDGILSQTT